MEMNRTIEQWRGCDPEAMAYHMSEAATMYAFKDAKADILALHAENERLRAQAQHESDCAEAYKAEADRLRDENESLRGSLEEWRLDLNSLRDENAKLRAELNEVASALPGTYYMDPPDGGSVTIAEQVGRMAKDAERYRWVTGGEFIYERWQSAYQEWGGQSGLVGFDAAIDEAMRKVE